tara:strand:+ start:190 stop:402 length:213 start_codon:yes stop_codon:yes gene_type:complete
MASREGMLFKFFEKWKNNRLNKFAEKVLKDNPDLEKSLKKIDDAAGEAMKKMQKDRKKYGYSLPDRLMKK